MEYNGKLYMLNEYIGKLYTLNESKINGRGVWHYLIDTPTGQIRNVVEYENPQKELIRFSIDNLEEAAAKYNDICINIVSGKL